MGGVGDMSHESECRSCRSTELRRILSFGETPLANRLIARANCDDPEPRYPLEVVFCPACSLVQITETIPPDVLFRDYVYLSSFSDTVVENAEAAVEAVLGRKLLTGTDLVLEVASNDGYLLQHYQRRGIPILGIEPASNIAQVATERGIPTRNEFFTRDLAEQLRSSGTRGSVIHAHNVLAHVADLNGFVEGLSRVLRDDGICVIEVPYLRDMIVNCEFDTIYHEHLFYYSLTALDRVLRRNGLVILDVERTPIHGGSLCIFAGLQGSGEVGAPVRAILDEEQQLGITRPTYFHGFAERVETLRNELAALLSDLKAQGMRIAAYGAAAKGTVLLNAVGIGPETLEFVADRSPHKQGLYMPGVHVPIVPPERLLEDMPDVVLLLAWNFADEILHEQEEYRWRGGRFLIPLPEPKVI